MEGAALINDGIGMASPAPSPRKSIAWKVLAPIIIGIVLSALATLWMPWERVHPNDPTLRESIGSAPFWSHGFDGVVGARIDWISFLTNLAIIWILCVIGAVMMRDRASAND